MNGRCQKLIFVGKSTYRKISVGAPTQRQPFTNRAPTEHRPNGCDQRTPKTNHNVRRHEKSPLEAGLFWKDVRYQGPTRMVTTRAGSSM